MRQVSKRRIAATVLGLFLTASAGPAGAADSWFNLSPKEKERVRRNIDRWEKLPPQDKERLREQWDRWKKLPPDRRDQIRQRFDQQRREQDRD